MAEDTEELLESLVDVGIVGTGFMWDAERRKRVETMAELYGPAVTVMMHYVWQGGYRDLLDFQNGYEDQFNYRKDCGELQEDADPAEHAEAVRLSILELAKDDTLPYLLCPFMKARAMTWIENIADDRVTAEEVLCYVAEGISRSQFRMDPERIARREEYLRGVGLLR